MRKPTAKSLILDLLSSLGGRSMPISALIAAGELFGFAEGSLRVAMTRLVASERVERDERGLYRMGPAATAIDATVRRWRDLEERTHRWTQAWIGVHLTTRAPRGAKRTTHDRALRWFGFAELTPALWIRPDNLRGGVEDVRTELSRLGLDPRSMVMRIDALDPTREKQALTLWDAAALEHGYESARRDVADSEERLANMHTGAAMVESFQVGGRIIRQLTLDPLLPEPMIETQKRRLLVADMRRYDRRGRRAWAEFMEEHGAPAFRAPVHTDGGAGLPPAHGEMR